MLLKAKDLRDKSVDELKSELKTLYNDLFEAKMALHSRTLENLSSIREIKKSVARIYTVIKEKEELENA